MNNSKKTIVIGVMSTLLIAVIIQGSFSYNIKHALALSSSYSSSPAYAQSQTSNNAALVKPLPVLLIHGYLADASTWKRWEDLLKKDGIQYFPITFYKSDDKCGTAADHAKELSKQIQQIQNTTGSKQVNIVGHSKGGLDARVYLFNNIKENDVANLIMIGVPNAGSPLAQSSNICKPAVDDLKPGAADTKVGANTNTKYYTIAGDWNPSLLLNCPQLNWLPAEEAGYLQLPKPNDGLVPLSSVESQGYFHNLGHTQDCHSNLLGDKEYGLAKPILLGK
jgi:triacylglycerol lipase